MTYRIGELFSGIHGFGYGLSGIGDVVWSAEKAEFPRSVGAARFPDADHIDEVQAIDAGAPPVEILTAGFPCQDLSLAGHGAGLEGDRSGLYREVIRVAGLLAPPVVILENVPALLTRGFELVVADLCELGYSVEWDCLPAASVGAPHLRDRVWIVAHHGKLPCIFGGTKGLFPHAPPPSASGGRLRWPRAGFTTTPGVCLELEPLAPVGPVKRGVILPTPTKSVYGSSQNGINRTRPSAGTPSLHTMARSGLWPTPTGQDAANDGGPSQHRRNSKPLNAAVQEPALPTPVSGHLAGGGGGGELQHTINHGETRGQRERRLAATPRASDADRGGRGDLIAQVKERPNGHSGRPLLPTVVASDAMGSRRSTARTDEWESNEGTTLLDAVREDFQLFPTPKAAVSGPDYARADRERSGGDDLATHAARYSTPTSANRDSAGGSNSRAREKAAGVHVSGQLNPDFVEWMMGFPIGWTNPEIPNEELQPISWVAEPEGMSRITDERHLRRDRLEALGNALVPQVPLWVAARFPRRRPLPGL